MNLANRILYAMFQNLSALAGRLGRDRAMAIGAGVADAVWRLYRLTPYRDFVAGNFMAAYPGLSAAEANAMGHAHLRQLLKCIAELLRFPAMTRPELSELVAWQGGEHLAAALARGKGVIVVSAHFGNYELLGAALATRAPVTVLVQPPSKGAFEQLFIEYRDLVGVSTHSNTGPASLRPAIRALQRNEIVALLSDQHGEAQEAIVQLFGHPVSVPMGAFYLAKKTGAALIPGFMVRTDQGHRLEFDPELAVTGTAADAQAYCTVLERQIRAHPDHWLWVHNRWEREGELRLPAAEAGRP
ncbi:MAG TPA: lysophospholipid acyltransferase family protein [Stenomitos sp.]